jgi:hypothetical protein
MLVLASRYFAWEDAHMTTELPGQRPEGKLIQDALTRDGRSIRTVAPLAGITDARWRQLVKGSMKTGDQVHEQVARAETLARMAYVVGVTPQELAGVDREDAAVVLERLHAAAERGDSVVPLPATGTTTGQADEIDMIYASQSMTARQKLKAIRQVMELRAQADAEEAGARQEAPADAEAPMEPQS